MSEEQEEQRVDRFITELENFLNEFEEYSGEVFGGHRQYLLDHFRTNLQFKEPIITQILEEGYPGYSFVLGNGKSVLLSSLLATALMGGGNEETYNFFHLNSSVTSILRRALGKLNNGLWPTKETKPKLIIHDQVLKERCTDLLNAPGNYDRVVREATTILEDRIRNKPSHAVLTRLIPNSNDQQGRTLIDRLFNPDIPVLSVNVEKTERIKFRDILVGIISYLRNPYHHHIDNNTEWSWAWSTVGFIDTLLSEIDNCKIMVTQ